MAYTLDIDPFARAQIRELPPAGAVALASALAVLELVPERGERFNTDRPDRSIASSTTGGSAQPPCRRENGWVLDEFEW